MPLMKKTSDFIASYKLSCVVFLLLLLLTYLGTLHQVEHGLYQSQQKYFESLILIHWAYGMVPLPLPGGYLLLIIAFVNMFWGAVVRFRFRWSKVGFMLMHAGILILLVGAFISYVFSINGRMILYEGETSHEVENSYEWEIGISEAFAQEAVTEYIIRQSDFENLSGRRSRRFVFAGLPFTLELRNYMPNATMSQRGELVVLSLDKEHQRNMAAVQATLIDSSDGVEQSGVVWAGSRVPDVLDAGGKSWNISMRRQRIQLPFAIRLDKFTNKVHPGTNTPSEFISDITKIEDGISQHFKINMNEPFRHLGYTFYQSSWGQQGAGTNTRTYSVLSVVKNPADKVPLYATLITTIGLVMYYARKLASYLRREKARNS